eukprot:5967048-Prymnesium_polylepis.1
MAVKGVAAVRAVPTPPPTSLGGELFAEVPTPGRELAAILFVEIYMCRGRLSFFILEQLTLPEHRRKGMMVRLMDAMQKIAGSIPGVTDDNPVDLVVRSRAKQQHAARSFDDLFSFEPKYGDECIDDINPDPTCENYLGTTLGKLREVPVHQGPAPEIVCRASFRSAGLRFERQAAKAMRLQHMCLEGHAGSFR